MSDLTELEQKVAALEKEVKPLIDYWDEVVWPAWETEMARQDFEMLELHREAIESGATGKTTGINYIVPDHIRKLMSNRKNR